MVNNCCAYSCIIALAGPVSCFVKDTQNSNTTHHVNPSWCKTLVDLLVRTEPCLRTNKAIDKKTLQLRRISERRYIVNGHPMVKQGLGTWWQRQSTRHGHDQSVWAGPLTGGERAPAGDGPAKGGRRRSPKVGSQIFSPHQPSGHRRFCRTLWVTSTAS